MPPQLPTNNSNANRGFGFFTMVAGVMAALKLKEYWDSRYQPVASDEEPTTPGTPAPPYRDDVANDEEAVSLINTEIQTRRTGRRAQKKCCVCCGINCGLFWKAFGIVCGLMVLWGIFKGVMWAITPAPTGLEGMPQFSSSLSCQTGKYLYNGSDSSIVTVPISEDSQHALTIRGSGVGTLTIAEASPLLKDVEYKMSIRSDSPKLLDLIRLDQASTPGKLALSTGMFSGSECVRFDVTMYIPKDLKTLSVESTSNTQIKFDPSSKLDTLSAVRIKVSNQEAENSLILPSVNLKAEKMNLELWRGYLVGEVALVKDLTVSTQQGDAIANLHVKPALIPEADPSFPESAVLTTMTGAGRTDIFYESDKGIPHRPIHSSHTVSRTGDLYLNYKQAEFSGKIGLKSTSYSATGAQSLPPADAESDGGKWTHWVGEKTGGDTLTVSTRGYTKLTI